MLAVTMLPEGFLEGEKVSGLMVVLRFAFASLRGVIG
jgi:hypothetical protein